MTKKLVSFDDQAEPGEGLPAAVKSELNATYGRKARVNVDTYGATGDGTTDDSPAIRAAIADGHVVEFTQGRTYLITETGYAYYGLGIPADTTLVGNGATIKLAPGSRPGCAILEPLGAHVRISDLILDGSRAGQTVETQPQRHGIMLDYATHVTIHDCRILNCAGDGIIFYRTCSDIHIRNCEIYDTDRNGISFTGGLTNVTVDGCHLHDVAAQALDGEPDNDSIIGCSIKGNVIESSTQYALTMSGRAGNPSKKWTVTGNIITGPVLVHQMEDSTFTGNTVDASTFTTPAVHITHYNDGVIVSGNALRVAGSNMAVRATRTSGLDITRLIISDNVITYESGSGVVLEGVRSASVRGNAIEGGDAGYGVNVQITATMDAVQISDNHITHALRGIYAAPAVGGSVLHLLSICNNVIDDPKPTPNMSYGVQVVTAAAYGNLVCSDNVVRGAIISSSLEVPPTIRLGGVRILSGSGDPNGAHAAPMGAVYLRTDGGLGSSFYVKESGMGATGWTAK